MNSTATRFNPALKLLLNDTFKPFLRGETIAPTNVEISPCQVCNAHCDWCFYKGTHAPKINPKSVLDEAIAKRLLFDCMDIGVKAITWTGGGEPTLHPAFEGLAKFAYHRGLEQGLFTNGLVAPKYDPAFFEWIRVSNTDAPWRLPVLRELRARTKVLGMAVNYNGDDSLRGGDESVMQALDVGHQVGVDYVQVRQALNLRGHVTSRNPPQIDDPLLWVTDYKFDDSSNPHGYSECYGYHFVPFVWETGDVDVCGYHKGKGAPYTLGNLHKQSFAEIMGGAPRSVPVISTCQVCCKNHECNKAVNQTLTIKDADFL